MSGDPGGPAEPPPGALAPAVRVDLRLRPSVQAAEAHGAWSQGLAKAGIAELAAELTVQSAAVTGGDLGRVEAMLTTQAHTLNLIFNKLAACAGDALRNNSTESADQMLRLAFRAQGQCRATVETIFEMKNPRPVAFIQQANVGHAVQVNNGPAGAREGLVPRNELLEYQHGERLEFDAPTASGRTDPPLAAVGPIHGTADPGRQGQGIPERIQGEPGHGAPGSSAEPAAAAVRRRGRRHAGKAWGHHLEGEVNAGGSAVSPRSTPSESSQ